MAKLKLDTRPKHTINMRLDFDTYDILRQYAISRDRSLSFVLNRVLGVAARQIESGKLHVET